MWSYCNPVDKLVFFEYQRRRGNKHARPVLQNYKGYLQSDGYFVQFVYFIGAPSLSPVNVTEELCLRFRDYLLERFTGDTPMNYWSRLKKRLKLPLNSIILSIIRRKM